MIDILIKGKCGQIYVQKEEDVNTQEFKTTIYMPARGLDWILLS
jgi:hypothetical protein